jgi:serine/threonine protein phosphatase PrpC
MLFESSAVTHVGKVRELNEDAYAERSDIGVWLVADGMGGHAAGEVASRTLAGAIKELGPANNFDELFESVKSSLGNANRQLRSQSATYSNKRTPGSTVVVLIIDGTQGAVIWVGDSRIYRYRDQHLVQLTHDHSHVQALVDQGLLKAEEAGSHALTNLITRAIGIGEPIKLDSRLLNVKPGDQYLLCSDGLSRMVPDTEIESAMDSRNNEDITRSLLHTSLLRGAPDNITLICVQERSK